jgi:NAD(P)H dehydrogenase (quinone)
MKHLIVYCHPNPKSFNRAILDVYRGLLEKRGDEVTVRELYAGSFDPVLHASDLESFSKKKTPPDIKNEQDLITRSDVMSFIYPIWWFQMPAMLKGYIDRVFSRSFAYDVTSDGPVGLLKGKKAVIINTTGGDETTYDSGGFRGALQTAHDAGTFGFCGIEVVYHRFFYAVPFVSEAERGKMLEDLAGTELPF